MLAENVNRDLAGLQGKAFGNQKMAVEPAPRLHINVAARRTSGGKESDLGHFMLIPSPGRPK